MRKSMNHGQSRRAFSLVELLVVIGIIVVLMSLLLPALQRAREAYNMGRCANNLAQIGKAITAYTNEMPSQRYPTGGGDFANVRTFTPQGLPGSDDYQDWGWAYQILRQMEKDSLWSDRTDATVRAALVAQYFCPTRRNPTVKNGLAMTDYAGNAGAWTFTNPADGNPYVADTLIPDVDPTLVPQPTPPPALGQVNVNVNLPSPSAPSYPVKSGIFIKRRAGVGPSTLYIDTPVRKMTADVQDGFSYTILVAEKRINMSLPEADPQVGDRHGYCSGYSNDTLRTGYNQPARDYLDWNNPTVPILDGFGSSHSTSFNALFCDGSVRKIRYSISLDYRASAARPLASSPPNTPIALTLFQRLCHRSDAQQVPQSEIE